MQHAPHTYMQTHTKAHAWIEMAQLSFPIRIMRPDIVCRDLLFIRTRPNKW